MGFVNLRHKYRGEEMIRRSFLKRCCQTALAIPIAVIGSKTATGKPKVAAETTGTSGGDGYFYTCQCDKCKKHPFLY